MAFSQNEIEAMGKRAARGAGYSWGLAEEAGKAARWLSSRGLPGPEELAEILTRNDGKDIGELAPVSVKGVWRATGGRLCPLITGAALSDRAAEIAAGSEFELGETAQPLLLAPFLAGAAKQTGTAIELSWDGVAITFTREGFSIEGDPAAVQIRSAPSVHCRSASTRGAPTAQRPLGRDVDAETWSRLNTFAQRTFAPATEASRRAGAGAGLTDND